jgi:hypothetical protein
MDLRSGCSVVLGLALLVMGGCGGYTPPAGLMVKGKILKGGKPLEVTRPDVGLGCVEVRLVPLDDAAKTHGAESCLTERDGSFSLIGGGKGVSPGKYRVAIFQFKEGYGNDELKGAFSDTQSTIEVVVPADRKGGPIDLGTIDLDQPAAKKP